MFFCVLFYSSLKYTVLIVDQPTLTRILILRDAAFEGRSAMDIPDLLGLVNQPSVFFDLHSGFMFHRLHYPLHIFFDVKQHVEHTVVNRAICGFVGHSSSAVCPWYGTVAIFKICDMRSIIS